MPACTLDGCLAALDKLIWASVWMHKCVCVCVCDSVRRCPRAMRQPCHYVHPLHGPRRPNQPLHNREPPAALLHKAHMIIRSSITGLSASSHRVHRSTTCVRVPCSSGGTQSLRSTPSFSMSRYACYTTAMRCQSTESAFLVKMRARQLEHPASCDVPVSRTFTTQWCYSQRLQCEVCFCVLAYSMYLWLATSMNTMFKGQHPASWRPVHAICQCPSGSRHRSMLGAQLKSLSIKNRGLPRQQRQASILILAGGSEQGAYFFKSSVFSNLLLEERRATAWQLFGFFACMVHMQLACTGAECP